MEDNVHLHWQILTFSWLDPGKIYTNLYAYCLSPQMCSFSEVWAAVDMFPNTA
jgi:hypothetical protein